MKLAKYFVLAFVFSPFHSMSLHADPLMMVIPEGINDSGNREWLVRLAPDPLLFSGGSGSLSVELGFEIEGSDVVSVATNSVDWAFDIPGNNPFTGGISIGVQLDPADDTVFAALGSNPFMNGDFVDTLILETSGSGPTTVNWGGQTLLPGTPDEYIGSRISQSGINFDGYVGTVSIPEPSAAGLLLGGLGLALTRRIKNSSEDEGRNKAGQAGLEIARKTLPQRR